MTVIEETKSLRETKRVLGENRGFSTGGRLRIRFFETRGQNQQRPNLVTDFAGKNFRDVILARGKRLVDCWAVIARVYVLGDAPISPLQLSEDGIRAHRRVLT